MFEIKKEHITFIIFSGFLIRIVVALINSFISPTLGGESDAIGFDYVASHYALTGDKEIHDITRPGWLYSLVLGHLYRYFFDSIFFGCVLSIIAWLLTVLVSIRLLEHLRFDNYSKFYAVLILSFLPSSIFYTSITLREPFQMLFITLLVYSMVRFYKTNSVKHLICIPIFSFFLGALHQALVAISLASIGLFIIFISLINLKKKLLKVRFYIIFLVVFSLVPLSLSVFQDYSYNLEIGFITAVSGYQEGLIPDAIPRAHYRIIAIEDDILSFLFFLPLSFIQYQLEPFPWKIGGAIDLFFFFENVIRVYLIYKTVTFLVKSRRSFEDKNIASLLFIFFMFLLIEFMWAVGTVNWGTASRHHMPALALLVIASAPSFSYLHKLISSFLRSRDKISV